MGKNRLTIKRENWRRKIPEGNKNNNSKNVQKKRGKMEGEGEEEIGQSYHYNPLFE